MKIFGVSKFSLYVLIIVLLVCAFFAFQWLRQIYDTALPFKSNPTITEARRTGNAELCKKLSGVKHDECIAEVAIETNNQSLCADINPESRDSATENILNNISADVPTLRDVCFSVISQNTKNPSLCEQAGNLRGDCLFKVAIETRDKSLCESINDQSDCVEYVSALQPGYCDTLSSQYEKSTCFFRAAIELHEPALCEKTGADFSSEVARKNKISSCKLRACEGEGLECCSQVAEENKANCRFNFSVSLGDESQCKVINTEPKLIESCLFLVRQN